ncbi:amidohydrolase [Paroceanicella profunda]|uniref:Amidohydrolase n=1 Tax=Paroceanicella profunda TaxID=2579971 RepID=A0A5B8FIP5_9RHOB|nr:amidohydrolase [Paroceanicella profunda]QDL93338.1 amidohydrolase [Paroceanicella profunda]
MSDATCLRRRMTDWRHSLHEQPEFGFEEHGTAALIARTLEDLGLEVVRGVGGTGVVASLRRGSGNRAIALRADMDALRIAEAPGRPHGSRKPGLMHACGHDGHVAMLLGAATTLAEEGGFDGTVRFVFQPAEEWGRGAIAMLEDNLLARFPFDEIHGIHNMPGMPLGHVETRPGPLMAAEDIFEITLQGIGGHAARPEAGREALVAGCALVGDLQTIASRRLSPSEAAVLSVTEVLTDGARNVLPGNVRILGDARSFSAATSARIEAEMRRIAAGIGQSYALEVTVDYRREFVPLVNDPALVGEVLAAASTQPGVTVSGAAEAVCASEDFARFLDHVPGVFTFLGNGVDSAPLHNPSYDFNDDLLLTGAGLFAAIARRRLPDR